MGRDDPDARGRAHRLHQLIGPVLFRAALSGRGRSGAWTAERRLTPDPHGGRPRIPESVESLNHLDLPEAIPGPGKPSSARDRRGARKARTTVRRARSAKSMSASVVVRPRPKRIDAPASGPTAPIAWSTCDGAWLPELQAEPVETARSPSAISSASPSIPAKLTCRLCGSRFGPSGPFTARPPAARAGRQQAVAHGAEPRASAGISCRQICGLPEADDARDVQGAGPQAVLVPAAVDLADQRELSACACRTYSAPAPLGRSTCAPSATAGRCSWPRRRSAPCRPPAPRRCGTARRARG
jgi:hypothetical protein